MANLGLKTKSFLIKCKRVWLILRKPSRQEYTQVAKISALGIVFLGVIGFLISILMKAFA